jgi:hypothetical protein
LRKSGGLIWQQRRLLRRGGRLCGGNEHRGQGHLGHAAAATTTATQVQLSKEYFHMLAWHPKSEKTELKSNC